MSAVPPVLSDKTALRAMLRQRRLQFVTALGTARGDAERRIADAVLQHFGAASDVALYLAQSGEVDPAPIATALAAIGIAAALPFSDTRDAVPAFRRWAPGDPLATGPFGVPQPMREADPAWPDMIVAPLLGFDGSRHRLGQGAGWYDRAFAAFPGARRVGLAWSVQEVDALPRDPWDLPLEFVVTEQDAP